MASRPTTACGARASCSPATGAAGWSGSTRRPWATGPDGRTVKPRSRGGDQEERHDPRTRSQRHPTPRPEPAPGQDLFGLGARDRQAVLAWVGEHLPQVRRSVDDQRDAARAGGDQAAGDDAAPTAT